MRDDISSTAQYLAMVTGLRDQLADADKKAAKLRTTLEQLLESYGEPTYRPVEGEVKVIATTLVETPPIAPPPQASQAVKIDLSGMMVGEACVAVLRAAQRPMRNREILDALIANGFDFMGAKDPINNVTSAMGHRFQAARDVDKVNRMWVAKKSEGPAVSEASHMNGAAVPAA